MRSLASPSHSSGIFLALTLPLRIRFISARSRDISRPISMFVPELMVTGRSVLSRKVRQGTPRNVVSS